MMITPKEFRLKYLPMLSGKKRERNMQLNGKEPAMEQLSRMVMQLVSDYYWERLEDLLVIYKDPETVYDLFMTHYQFALSHFLRHKVDQKKYNRKYSFYLNVWSSVVSVHYDVESVFVRRHRDSKSTFSIYGNANDEGSQFVEIIGVHEMHLPLTHNPVKKSLDELIEEDRAILGLD